MRRGGCRKVLPVCHCLALVHFTFDPPRFDPLRFQLLRRVRPSLGSFTARPPAEPLAGGASAPTMAALFE